MTIQYKLKVYPITEHGEEIFCGGFFDVVSIDFITYEIRTRRIDTWSSSKKNAENYDFFDRWDLFESEDQRHYRDSPSELYASVNGGEWEWVEIEKRDTSEDI